ncbi:MAG: Gfo/Idh/MocA family oxidoreductase [Pirellulaceae bacterium]|nr:Gfo/Idh/MocA family oxidoreductase [Pirellulaceae bacterium]
MNLTPEERQIGKDNYHNALSVSRREFLGGLLATGAVSSLGFGAIYFGYEKIGEPLRVGVIGTGDEGCVLIGAMNPNFIQVKAICDIRPLNLQRAFYGDHASAGALKVRPGLCSVFGWNDRKAAEKEVKVYQDYKELVKDPNIDAVVIALPLHLHAEATVAALKAGKHVLTEKLMAHNVAQCKVMSRLAQEKGLHLATGHQRHYNVLYDNAVNLLQWGLLGEIHHIRAQWHRGNLPGKDSWKPPLPGGEMFRGVHRDLIHEKLKNIVNSQKKNAKNPAKMAELKAQEAQWRAWRNDANVDAEKYGYQKIQLADGSTRSALEELCRWRLWDRTGGGLMAELGSHQLDAASIFVSALRKDKKKSHPLTVHAVGGRHLFPLDRDADDHVYCMFEFPGPGYDAKFDVGYKDPHVVLPNPKSGVPAYEQDPNKKIVVSYSSINGNGFGDFGEVVMGTKGTLILEKEKEVMLFKGSSTSTRVEVKNDTGVPTMNTHESGGGGELSKSVQTNTEVSRGYTEEMEHLAYCIRNPDKENQPRCHPEVALADAVIALTAKTALHNGNTPGKHGFIAFEEDWFDIDSDATPDGSSVANETKRLDT